MKTGFLFSTAFFLLNSIGMAQEDELDVLLSFSLEELSDMAITSASNVVEKLSDAPATVIVISKEEIEQRGYNDVSEIFDDLPGMEIVRPYGDTYFKNYWRGYRNTIGAPFLVMVDGVSINSLYFGIVAQMASLPLTAIVSVHVPG